MDANEILGRRVSGTFVNHWDQAIRIHTANHPGHRHLEEDLFMLDPAAVFPKGTSCSLLWASPSCTFFSVARGAACVNEQDRSHAHSITDWVKHLNPEAVIVENVPEFVKWGPVVQKRGADGALVWGVGHRPVTSLPAEQRRRSGESEEDWALRMVSYGYQRYEVPDKSRTKEYFDGWMESMRELGYDVDHRVLKSADYGDPTIRRRLFVYFVRKDSGRRIVWPKPYAEAPPEDGVRTRPMLWRTARDIIDWDIQGESVFTRKKKLAANTFRRLAIGLVKYGLRDFLISSAHDPDQPLQTLTARGERGVVMTDAYVLPKDQGHDKTHVRSADAPVSALTTNHRGEGIVEPYVVQMKGCSNAQDVDEPLSAATSRQSHYVAEPALTAVDERCSMVDNIRRTGVVHGDDEPLRAATAGGGHHAIAEAFMFAIDQTGGSRKNDGTYSMDEPVRTVVTKHNQACIEMDVEILEDRFVTECEARGVDTSRARTFLEFLMSELHRRGVVDAKPWIYVYYSSGAEGKDIDEPLPTVRTKAGHALVYPVVELYGRMIRIDLRYRMLSTVELQRAMGFPDDMAWAGVNKTDQIRAIGNSVSRGVARALGLAWYSQDPDVWKHVKEIYETS